MVRMSGVGWGALFVLFFFGSWLGLVVIGCWLCCSGGWFGLLLLWLCCWLCGVLQARFSSFANVVFFLGCPFCRVPSCLGFCDGFGFFAFLCGFVLYFALSQFAPLPCKDSKCFVIGERTNSGRICDTY